MEITAGAMFTLYATLVAVGAVLGVAFMSGWGWFILALGFVLGFPAFLYARSVYVDWKFQREYSQREALRRDGLGGGS